MGGILTTTERRTWLQSGMATCPSCGKRLFRTVPQIGLLFLSCEVKRCDFVWWCIALPPKATLHHLEHVVGSEAAQALIAHCNLDYPIFHSRDALWPAPIEGQWPTVFLNIEVSRHERHQHLRSAPETILRSLGILERTNTLKQSA